MHGRASPAARSHGLHPFWGSLSHLEFAKSQGNVCISCLCTLFGRFVSHFVFYRMHFAWHFQIFAMLRHHFAEKWALLSELTSHKYVRLTLPARYGSMPFVWNTNCGLKAYGGQKRCGAQAGHRTCLCTVYTNPWIPLAIYCYICTYKHIYFYICIYK